MVLKECPPILLSIYLLYIKGPDNPITALKYFIILAPLTQLYKRYNFISHSLRHILTPVLYVIL
jgi:hypothetical protein